MNQRMIQATQDDIRKDSKRLEITQFLNSLLADEYLLSTKTKSYHWNVTGPHFYELHRLFGDQYAQIDQLIDQIGERVRALGAKALGTMTEFLRCARLQERPGVYPSEWTMADDLYDDHEVLVHSLRGALAGNESLHCDISTSDFLTGVMQQHEKMAWILRSILGKRFAEMAGRAGDHPSGDRDRKVSND